MDNADLLKILKQDLYNLNTTVKSIFIKCPVQLSSWLFPTKSQEYVQEIIENKHIEKLSYTKTLELIIDRLYVTIRLTTKYLESNFSLRQNRLILRPKQLTLGFSTGLLWNLLEGIMENNTYERKTDLTTKNDIPVEKEIQTDLITINKCDSCASAMVCMKNIMDCFENSDADFKCDRETLKYRLYDITQFGSMLKATSSIENSLSAIFGKLREKNKEIEMLKIQCGKLKSEINEKLGSVTLLEKEVDIFKGKYENDKLILMRLREENFNLLKINNKYDLKIKQYEEIVNNLNLVIGKDKQRIKILLMEKNKLNQYLEKCTDEQKYISKKIIFMKNNNKKKDEEFESLQYNLTNQLEIINNFYEIIDKIKKSFCIINLQIQNMYKQSENDSNDILLVFRELKEKMSDYILKINFENSKTANTKTELKLKGNPIEDMTTQIEDNKKNIKLLEEENIKLENLVNKFSTIKIPIKT